jgi:phage shock protein PspC (stress-responsive transcriptional regulator)
MKKTVTINLHGQVFIIDDDAYQLLKEYLKSIESHFKNGEEVSEIIEDVEIRIAEILKENLHNKKEVVEYKDIEEIIRIMGEPADFVTSDYRHSRTGENEGRGYKRIYRDPDNRVIGGVCGGLGAYFNFDPLILRILFIIAVLGFGSGILVYIILWIVIPEAKTIAQKLEMKGEPVTVSNINRKMKDEFNNIKNNMKRS